MKSVMTIGLDIAKSVFQVHGVDESGEVVIRRKLKRRSVVPFFRKLPPCLVGIEACATAHHWSRELSALGHEVKLMPLYLQCSRGHRKATLNGKNLTLRMSQRRSPEAAEVRSNIAPQGRSSVL